MIYRLWRFSITTLFVVRQVNLKAQAYPLSYIGKFKFIKGPSRIGFSFIFLSKVIEFVFNYRGKIRR